MTDHASLTTEPSAEWGIDQLRDAARWMYRVCLKAAEEVDDLKAEIQRLRSAPDPAAPITNSASVSSKSASSAEPSDEVAWLIESTSRKTPVYVALLPTDANWVCWERDPNKAHKFPSRTVAEAFIADRQITRAAAKEHMWMAANAPEPRDEQWQPIATAPKDGRWILLGSYTSCCMGYWSPGDGWKDQRDSMRGPTHWMPLPPRPAATKGEDHD